MGCYCVSLTVLVSVFVYKCVSVAVCLSVRVVSVAWKHSEYTVLARGL